MSIYYEMVVGQQEILHFDTSHQYLYCFLKKNKKGEYY